MMHGAKANILEAVGGTAIVRLQRLVPPDLDVEVYVKCEQMNPGGSLKDRVAVGLVDRAEREGLLKPAGTIVAATGGDTGASLAMVAAVRGYRCVFAVSDKTSQEKVATLRAWGARVVMCPAVEPQDARSHHAVARRIAEESPGAFLADGYHDTANPDAHYRTTGPEIWAQTKGEFDVLVGGIHTGGTLHGTGKFLKEKNPALQVVGVDPVGSVFYDFVKHGLVTRAFSYQVEGVGAEFFPTATDVKGLDEVVRVDDRDCFMTARDLARLEGIFAGGASGAAVAGALKYARERRRKERILVLLSDGAGRHLSKIFNDDWMRENGFLNDEPMLGTVREVLQLRAQTLVTARSDDTLRTVIGRMKSAGISQLPVVDGEQLRGIVTEVDVLRNLVSGEGHLDGPIANILDSDYATVTPDTRVDLLQRVLAEAKVALVTEGPRLLGLVSKIDVIDYLSRRVAGP